MEDENVYNEKGNYSVNDLHAHFIDVEQFMLYTTQGLFDRLGLGNEHLPPDASVEELGIALQADNWALRAAAARQFTHKKEIFSIENLITAALYDREGPVRAAALRTLATLKNKVSIKVYIDALNDLDWNVRVAGVEALGEQGEQIPLTPLLAALKDEHEAVRAAALLALGGVGEHAPVEVLVEALRDSEWQVRETAILVLGRLGERAPMKHLILARYDKNELVRTAAEQVLEKQAKRLAPLPTEKDVQRQISLAALEHTRSIEIASEENLRGDLVMNNFVGQTFGEYRLLRFLGSGSFADVYEAEQIHLKTRVAIKLLRGAFTEQEMKDLQNEARLLVNLEHNHIIRMFTFNMERDIPYLVMSYAPNGSLDKLHPRGIMLPLSTIVSYVNQIADALQYAHKHDVIHRDINPANLLLGTEGQVLVADFGIAELARRTGSLRQQKVAGTPLYMAPEQFEGYAIPASDQYALGVVVYQWLCGEFPFKGNEYALAYQHKDVPPPPLSEKIPILPAVEAVVSRTLAKDPQERFPNIQDFANALEQAYAEDQTYMEEIKRLFTTPKRLVEALKLEHYQCRLLDLIARDKGWWHNIGQAVMSNLSAQAVQGSRTDITTVLSTLAQRATNEAIVSIKREDVPGFENLIDLLYVATPPLINPDVWMLLLEKLSADPHVSKIIVNNPDNWKIHSYLLKQWGSLASSVSVGDGLIRPWFPTKWPELWLFLTLPLPEEWHDLALTNLLGEAPLTAALSKSVVHSFEQEYATQLKNFLRRPIRSSRRRHTVINLFNRLVESGYAKKMDLLHILITADIDPVHVRNFMGTVFAKAYLTDEEIKYLLERYGARFVSYYQLPIVVDYARRYLLAFNPNDLDRSSAKQLIEFMSNNSLLPKELQALARNWQIIDAFIDRPLINKQKLLDLVSAIHQLEPSARSALLDKLIAPCINTIESEIDLTCIISAMDSALEKLELHHFMLQLTERIGERYGQQNSESILVPYIRITLQLEAVVQNLSSNELQEWTNLFLRLLLQNADKETYKKINAIVQNWPPRISAYWRDYASAYNSESKRLWPWSISH